VDLWTKTVNMRNFATVFSLKEMLEIYEFMILPNIHN